MSIKPPVSATAGTTDGIAYPLRSRMPVNAGDYGADTATADNGPAINAAIAALPAAGGVVTGPRGTFNYSTPLNFAGRRSITFRCEGGAGASLFGMGTVLQYTGTGTASPVLVNGGAQGIAFEGIDFRYNNSGFTGKYVDCQTSHDLAFRNCQFAANPAGGSIASAAAYLRLDQTYNVDIYQTWFKNGVRAITGKESTSSYANNINMTGGGCIAQTASHILDAGGSWTFRGVTFEGIVGDAAGVFDYTTANLPQYALNFYGCWLGDVLLGSGTQIRWGGSGLVVMGNQIGIETAGAKGIVIGENNCDGILIAGNHFFGSAANSYLDFGTTTGHTGVQVGPNSFTGVTNTIAGTLPANMVNISPTSAQSLALTGFADITRATSTSGMLRLFVTGDTQPRFQALASGKLQWGPGGASAVDADIARTATGILATGASTKLVATAGLGVGNRVAATEVIGKAVQGKMEVFDAAGASLGFVPLYSSIT